MKLQMNVPVSGLDLAALLQGEEGFFLCQNRGQNYITVAKSWSFDRFWANTHRANHPGTTVAERWPGALVRDQDQ